MHRLLHSGRLFRRREFSYDFFQAIFFKTISSGFVFFQAIFSGDFFGEFLGASGILAGNRKSC